MKVLVTGGNGFIGQYVVEELLEAGHTPVVFDRYDRDVAYLAESHVGAYLGDITDEVAVTEAIAHVDAFIHLAGVLGTQETIKNPKPAAVVNIEGGLNVFRAAAQYNVPGVNIAVGNYWMNNTYSITKSTMERFAAMFNKESGTQITIVRALNAYGPRQASAAPHGPSKVKKIMPAFVNAAIRNQPISIYGDGTQIMDMIYVGDVAHVLVKALEYTLAHGPVDGYNGNGAIFEAGSGIDTTVNDIADAVKRIAGSTADHEYTPMRPGEPEHSIVLGNPRTLDRISGLRPFKSLDDGIHETVRYFEDA